ncbi:LCP family protein [Thermopolyspora sp. NPDC052614]|uniref:LCP family protein n=1 Tax=Thermopolyspora sp. NPDC052614 TaxID=3155682 RepID=UPI0034255438
MTTRLERAPAETAGAGDGKRPRTRPPSGPPRFAKAPTTASVIGWTALSAVLPGIAHLRAGKRRLGYILMAIYAVLLVAAGVTAAVALSSGSLEDLGGWAVKDSTLIGVTVGAIVGAVAWFALMVHSFVSLRPQRLSRNGQVVAGVVAGVLCVAVMAPFAFTASSVQTAREVANGIFAPDPGTTVAPVKADDPWNGKRRVNFLLIGGDSAGNRTGVRTDSMTVASVDTRTGNTVLFSLPRNLQYVRFPKTSPLAEKFPNGFLGDSGQGLLNEVWYYTENHPEVQRHGHYRGWNALKDAIGHTLGMKIDYYAMVDMYGFAALIDAIGGLRIRVEQDVKWGGKFGTAGTIKAGYRKLSGEEVLWYGRSRVGSDDFSRMARQRCVIGALAQQATPSVVLANFTRIARAAKRLFKTDIPRDLLEHLVPLGVKVKNAKITSLQFVPPIIYTGNPDWHKIRVLTRRAIVESARSSRATLAAGSSPSANPGANSGANPSTGASASGGGSAATSASASAPSASPSGLASRTANPRQTPTPNDKAAKSLSELCNF